MIESIFILGAIAAAMVVIFIANTRKSTIDPGILDGTRWREQDLH